MCFFVKIHGWIPKNNLKLNCYSVNSKTGAKSDELINFFSLNPNNEIPKQCFPFCSNQLIENQRIVDPYFFIRLQFNETKIADKEFVLVQCTYSMNNENSTATDNNDDNDSDFTFRDGVQGIRFGIQLIKT